MEVELRHLRALVAVVDEGTFTDAAIALGVTQPSVSRSVTALERTVGTRLLERGARHSRLTPAGARVLDHARRVLDEVAALVRAGAGGELRLGYAWSALGRHTTTVQRRWAAEHPETPLVFVQSSSATGGLGEGTADVAVLRLPLDDRRFHVTEVGSEPRYAALAATDPLARRRTVTLQDLVDHVVAVDPRTGTTTDELWSAHAAPPRTRPVHGVEDWLTLIESGQAAGMSSQATARQHQRPGVVYRRVRDAPPVQVLLAWWRDAPPARADALLELVAETYRAG